MRRRDCLRVFGAVTASAVTRAALAHGANGRLVVVVNRGSPLDGVSLGLLRRIFLSQPVDEGGVRLVPFNSPPLTPERVLFDRVVLRMDPDEVGRHWVDQRIRGNPGPPRNIAGAKLLKQVVMRLPGAISYLHSEELDANLKALPVGGYEWTDRDYPIP